MVLSVAKKKQNKKLSNNTRCPPTVLNEEFIKLMRHLYFNTFTE